MKISDAKIVFSGVKSTYFVREKDGCLFEEAKAVFKNEGDAEVHAYLKASATSKDGRDFNLSVVTDCTVVNDKLQKTQKIKTQARGDQKRWI